MGRPSLNLVGKRFGKLVVVERDYSRTSKTCKSAYWKCQCDCGEETTVRGTHLTDGSTTSCGCNTNRKSKGRGTKGQGKLQDLTGKTFGRLTVIERAENKGHHSYWKCRCECGNTCVVLGSHLVDNTTRSCGCLVKDTNRERMKELQIFTTHGLSHTRLHSIWNNMISRCECINHSAFKNYGERGIKICKEWRENFEVFYNWAMENGYSDNLSIDRIDVNGDYTPSNCRWATPSQQARNKKNTIYITYKGIKKSLKDYAEEYGLEYQTLLYRMKKGWDVEKALTTPPTIIRNKNP